MTPKETLLGALRETGMEQVHVRENHSYDPGQDEIGMVEAVPEGSGWGDDHHPAYHGRQLMTGW